MTVSVGLSTVVTIIINFCAFFACGELDDEKKLTLAVIVFVEALPRRLDA